MSHLFNWVPFISLSPLELTQENKEYSKGFTNTK